MRKGLRNCRCCREWHGCCREWRGCCRKWRGDVEVGNTDHWGLLVDAAKPELLLPAKDVGIATSPSASKPLFAGSPIEAQELRELRMRRIEAQCVAHRADLT